MAFEKDLFISYAHIDNRTSDEDEEGWITRFTEELQIYIEQYWGSKVKIWRDDRLRGNDDYSDEIEAKLLNSAALLSVLSPRYLKSKWCIREVEEFCKAAEESIGLKVGTKRRLMRAARLPVPRKELPESLRRALGYEFFTEHKGTPITLNPGIDDTHKAEFHREICRLAYDIKELLSELSDHTTATPDAPEVTDKPFVYLAESSADLKEDRKRIRDELQGHGYVVLPDHRLPEIEREFISEVDLLLEHCSLAVHFVGENYGTVPDGPTMKSKVILQNEVALERTEKQALKRILWMPDGIQSDNELQKAFIDDLNRGTGINPAHDDLVVGNIETLKRAIHSALARIEKGDAEDTQTGSEKDAPTGPLRVYLVCEEADKMEVIPLLKHLRDQGLETNIPVFKGKKEDVQEANAALLRTSDAVLLFWGTGDEAWKVSKKNEIQECERTSAYKAVYTYIRPAKEDDENTDEKEFSVLSGEQHLLDARTGFDASLLAPFIEALGIEHR